ncbi:MAG: hypothetical protein AMXMBFR83_13370 [Phycisphaerae bacterium]
MLASAWGWWILIAGLAAGGLAGLGLLAAMRRTPFPPLLAFWWVMNRLYCRWWFRLRLLGECTVPAEGPVIVAANHTCGIDPLLVIACIPHRIPAYLVAEEYANPPLVGGLMKRVGCIPVRRDGQDTSATRAALRHLKAGNVLGIFIEGRIAPPGETLDAKDGAAMLAVHSGARVVPVHISGTRWDDNVFRSFLRRHRARVRFGEPIDLCPGGVKPAREQIPRISAMLLDRIRALAPAPPLRPGGRRKAGH